jgi:hypothetical protein
MGTEHESENFWADDPCVLFTNIKLLPMASMTHDEKLNVLTRLVIIASVVFYFMKYEFWFNFLLLGLLLIVLIKFVVLDKRDKPGKKEDFTLVPTYANPDMHTTTVAPLFSEEWQIYPPSYDLYTNTPPEATFSEPLMPQSYPYGQYLTRTNLLPSDEYASRMLNGGPKEARSYINNAFMRNELGYRENLTRLYKLGIARRFRANSNETFSPYRSY